MTDQRHYRRKQRGQGRPVSDRWRRLAPPAGFDLRLAGSLLILAALLGDILLIVALYVLPASGSRSSVNARSGAAVRAVAEAGDMRIELAIPSPAIGRDRFIVRLRKQGHAISSQPLLLTLSPPDHGSRVEVVRLTPRDGIAEATADVATPGRWHLTLRGPGLRVVHFLLRVGTADGALRPRLDPILESNGAQFAATWPVGSYAATLQVTPAAVGMNGFSIRLHGPHLAQFSTVRLALTMQDMDMGTTRLIARARRPGVYAAQGIFTMGGLWRVVVVAGRARSSAVLVVNARGVTPAGNLGHSGFGKVVVQTYLPYAGFVTEMGTNDVARLNGGIAAAGQTPHGIDFVAHRPYAYVTDMGGDAVRVMNIRTGTVAHTIPVGLGPAHIVFTPNTMKAYVTDFLSADVSVIDVRHHRVITRIPVGLNPHGIDITPDGRFVWVACAHGGGVWVIDTRRDRVAATIPVGLEPYGVTMGPPDSEKAYVSDYALNQVAVIALRSHRVIRRIPVGKAPALMVLAPGGNLYIADHDSNAVTVIAAATDRVLATIRVGAGPHGLDATPDGRYVYVANNNANTVSIIATRGCRVIETVHIPGRPNEVALQQRDDLHP